MTIEVAADGFHIPGKQPFRAATLDSCGDHRIAMAFTVAALAAEGDCVIENAEAASVSSGILSIRWLHRCNEISLHSRSLLSAAARKPVAGSVELQDPHPRTTTGTSGSRRNATPRTPPRASSTARARILTNRQ